MAGARVSIRFQYFTPWIVEEKREKITPFDFQRWIQRADGIEAQRRIRQNYNTKARLDIYDVIPKTKLWFFRFLRLRETNLPYTVQESMVAKDTSLKDDEYMAEGLYAIYDPERTLFMIQVNRNSLGINALQYYLTDIWGVEHERILLKPVMKEIDIKKYRRGIYRRLEVSFSNIPKDIDERKTSFFPDIFKSFSNIRCRTATISFGLGYGALKDTLNRDSIDAALIDIGENGDVISRAVIRCSDDTDKKTEIIDLLHCVEEDIITFSVPNKTSISHQTMKSEMFSIYRQRADQVANVNGR